MRTTLSIALIAVLALGCKAKDNAPKDPAPTAKQAEGAAPAATPTPAPAPKPVAKAAAGAADSCCCVTAANADGDPWMTAKECADSKGTCAATPTENCVAELRQQEIADQRNEANEGCPSKDRHDCDGDGFRAGEDKDDDNPKVH